MSVLAWFLTPIGALVGGFLAYKFGGKIAPTVKKNNRFLFTALILFVLGGGFGLMNSPMSMVGSANQCLVTDLQLNSITYNGTGTAQVSTTQDNVFDVRVSDANWIATNHIDFDVTVVRTGADACSIPIKVMPMSFKSQTDLTDTAVYSYVEKGTDGKYECYIEVSGEGTPTTSDAKQETVLGFTEGDVSNMFSVICDDLLDEMDEVNTYEHPGDIVITAGNQQARVEILKTG